MTFDWKADEVNVKISRLLDTIVNLAMEDQIITTDEEAIIEVVRQKLWKLESKIVDMINNDMSLEDAQNQLREYFEGVIVDATAQAKADKKITSDELVLIDKLANFLRGSEFVELIH